VRPNCTALYVQLTRLDISNYHFFDFAADFTVCASVAPDVEAAPERAALVVWRRFWAQAFGAGRRSGRVPLHATKKKSRRQSREGPMPRLSLEDKCPPNSAREARARQAAVRDRLRATVAAIIEAPPAVEAPPAQELPLPWDQGMAERSIAEIVAALATHLKISEHAILTDIKSPMAIDARRMAAALAVVWLKYPRNRVADHFGIIEGAITEGLKRLSPILLRYAISAHAPRSDAVGLIVHELSAAGELSPLISIAEVQRVICAAFGVTPHELVSERRLKIALVPRQLAMALSQRLTHRSLHDIGRKFGGRHHTSVLYAIRKVAPIMARAQAMLPDSAGLTEWVQAIKLAVSTCPGKVDAGFPTRTCADK
jgi:hypothetical protein